MSIRTRGYEYGRKLATLDQNRVLCALMVWTADTPTALSATKAHCLDRSSAVGAVLPLLVGVVRPEWAGLHSYSPGCLQPKEESFLKLFFFAKE